jgi:hypothetical protein
MEKPWKARCGVSNARFSKRTSSRKPRDILSTKKLWRGSATGKSVRGILSKAFDTQGQALRACPFFSRKAAKLAKKISDFFA